MIKLLGKIPNQFYLAVSGGIDSMVALDFFLNGRYKPTVLYFDHGTEFGAEGVKFVREKCRAIGLPLIVNKIGRDRNPNESMEEYWRTERYQFFNSLDGEIITAHHLDDATEWWLFTCLHGEGKIIPYRNGNVIRPFLLTDKKEIKAWAEKKDVKYINDPANADEKYMRSIIRHKLLPQALRVNPGLRTVIRKKIEKENK